jgi:hypothetical protein
MKRHVAEATNSGADVIFQRRLQQIVLIFLDFGCHTPVQFWPQSVAVARILSR